MKVIAERLYNGIIKENPTFVLLLGMCPTLAVTTSAINGVGMGLSAAAVLILSNLIISALRKVIPGGVRMPAYIVIVATLVTILQLLLQAYVPSIYSSLGLYIPLIVVNCIILGRAEAYAGKNKVLPSLFDGIGMGLGFTLALTVIGSVRELFGNGTLFGFKIMPSAYEPIAIIVLAPGAFFVLGMLVALRNKLMSPEKKKKAAEAACSMNCASCGLCNFNPEDAKSKAKSAAKPTADSAKPTVDAAKPTADAVKPTADTAVEKGEGEKK